MTLGSLWKWLRGRPATNLDHLEVVMYTRRGCHLCADAWRQLAAEQRRYGFRLEAVDVNTSPELVERYGERVPVVAVDGKVRFSGGVNPVLLRRLLRAAAHHKPTDGSPWA